MNRVAAPRVPGLATLLNMPAVMAEPAGEKVVPVVPAS